MDTGLPVIIDVAMTFAAEAVALFVTDEFPIVESQFVTISWRSGSQDTTAWFLHDGARYPHEPPSILSSWD